MLRCIARLEGPDVGLELLEVADHLRPHLAGRVIARGTSRLVVRQ